jgi:uncharacterized integral membrane protein (TIGR00698 family)
VRRNRLAVGLFLVGLVVAASGLVSPAVALGCGVLLALTVENPMRKATSRWSKWLLQASVVLLGFGMNLAEVISAGRHGVLYTAVSLAAVMAAGLTLGRMLRINGRASLLISVGTAICGGSAIAAVAPVADATEEEISVSMGTVFVLNSIALVIFPPIGHALAMTQNQFGLWAALAIHDTSSVVGACAAYGAQALAIGTTVKLTRALWIVPMTLLVAAWMRWQAKGKSKQAKVTLPWFILLFCVAAAVSTYLPAGHRAYGAMVRLGHEGLTATLFLIGSGLSRKTLKSVGWPPLVQGVVLWLAAGGLSLLAIQRGWIGM